MPPLNSIVISDDEEPNSQQTLSRDLALLDEEISDVNETVKELDTEVTAYTNLLKAAQGRLQKAREQKERLIDNKQKLLDKRLRFLQSNPSPVVRGVRSLVDVKPEKEISIKPEPARRPSAADVIEIDQVIKTSQKIGNSSLKTSSSHPTHPAPTSAPSAVPPAAVHPSSVQKPPLPQPLSLGQKTRPPTSDARPRVPGDLGAEPGSSSLAASRIPGPRVSPSANPSKKPSKNSGPNYFAPFRTTDDNSQLPSTRKHSKPQTAIRGRGRGSRRSYGGLSGIRLGASISGRVTSGRDSEEEQPQGKKTRAVVYSPYWEASDSEPELGGDLGRKDQLPALPQPPKHSQNIPTNPKTHSRIDISSVIGGKTQGTWCNVGLNKVTVYNAGSYMALDRGLNHLLPQNPGENGGVYVGDWLRKEVGKSYQIFIKRALNHWLFYGKYLIASIREVSLDEWCAFSDTDKNRWAEHMLEHQWGKNILQKKKLLTEAQCTKSNWVKVLGFFNRDTRPNLRLKVLELQFISYDKDLYDALNSPSSRPSSTKKKTTRKRKRYSSGYDEDESDYFWDDDEYPH